MKRVEQFEAIRRDHRDRGLSIRELARRHHVHRREVRSALASAVPPARKQPEREAPKLGPYKELIWSWLEADRSVHRKQRHTSRRIWQRLVDEHGADLAEGTVRSFVGQVRRELATNVADVAIVQHHQPGQEAEVDFGEFHGWIDGTLTKLYMFVMRMSSSGKAFHWTFATCGQEAFLEGHVRAFEYFGGVPRRIRYDNLKAAVVKVLLGRERLENESFVALRSHFGFDSFYCLPGVGGAHEKGGVEGEVGRFRRNHLVPVPHVESVAGLNEHIAHADIVDDCRHIGQRHSTVGDDFAAEQQHLSAVPLEHFDTTVHLRVRVDTKARVCVRQNHYSVPARLVGRQLDVRLGAGVIEVLDGSIVVAVHERVPGKGAEIYVLDHYLEVLVRKPGALASSRVLVQARASGAFSSAHDAFWTEARRRLGDQNGTRAMIEVLLLHRHLGARDVAEGIAGALRVNSVDSAVVAIEARRHSTTEREVVVPIDIASRFDRPAPDIEGYDTLLEAAK